MDKKNVSRNWAVEETNLFCEILIDYRSRYRFYDYIGTKVLKKYSAKEVFEEILNEFQERLLRENFEARNSENFKGKRRKQNLCSIYESEIQQYQTTVDFNSL